MTNFEVIRADCRNILGKYGDNCAIVTDPPYGIDLKTNYKTSKRGNLAECNDFPPIYGDSEPFDPGHLLRFEYVVLWGANNYANKLPPTSGWLVWDKREGMTPNDQSDCELAWTNRNAAARLFYHRWNGMIKASESRGRRVHPTQKPVALFRWVIETLAIPKDTLIIDPYLGSGSCGVAALELGYKFVGIEYEADYCRIAEERLGSVQSFYFS